MKGLVTITKVYRDGTKEPVCVKDPNILTQGFALDMANLMTAGANTTTQNYKFGYFQLGTSSYYSAPVEPAQHWTDALPYTTVRNFSRLNSPLATTADYGSETALELVTRDCIVYKEDFVPLKDIEYTKESEVLGVLNEDNCFPLQLPGDDENGVIIKITLDYGALNGKSLQEFGLFTRNPEANRSEDNPILTCYKSIQTPIEKTDEFMLEIDWAIQFVGTRKLTEDAARLISMHPAGIKRKVTNRVAVQNVGYVQEGDKFDVTIETPIPTSEDAYLYYNVLSDGVYDYDHYAVSGTHWAIVDSDGNHTSAFNSPLFWPKGTTNTTFTVSALDTGRFYGQKSLAFELSSYTGKDKYIDFQESLDGNVVVYHIRSSHTPNSLEFLTVLPSTQTHPIPVSGTISTNGLHAPVECSAYLDVSTNASLYRLGRRVAGVTSYFDGVFDSSRTYHAFPMEASTEVFALSSSTAAEFNVSLLNTPSGEPVYNLNTYSLDPRGYFQRPTTTSGIGVPPNINYLDISANRDDINVKSGLGTWTQENGMFTTANLEGWPGANLHSGFDVYNTQPPDGVLMRQFQLSSQPDGILPANFFYSPQELYVWPRNENKLFEPSCGKRRPGQYDYLMDGTGERPGGDYYDQVAPYDSSLSTVVFSTYIKKVDDITKDPVRTTDASVISNEFFQMDVVVRGYVGVGFYASQKSKNAQFQWNSQGGIDPIRVKAAHEGAFRLSNPSSLEILFTSATGANTFLADSDIGLQLSSSQYGVLGTIEGERQDFFLPNKSGVPVFTGSINVTSSLPYSFPFADLTGAGHTVSAVNGSLHLSSVDPPQVNQGPFGFTSKGIGERYDCGVFSGTNNGDTNASKDMAAYGYTDPLCKDGWYRVWVAADVPEDFYETSIFAEASPEVSGAFHERNIFPSSAGLRDATGWLVGVDPPNYREGDTGNKGNFYQVPTVASGCLIAWNQFERYPKTGAFHKGHSSGYMPRPYQSRPFSFFTPRFNAFTDDTGTSSVTLTIT